MRKHHSALLVAWLASVAASAAELSPTEDMPLTCENRLPEVQPLADGTPPMEGTRVEVLSTLPGSDAEVTRDSAVKLHVRYQIDAFTPDTYALQIMAAAVDSRASLTSEALGTYARLTEPSGEVVLCLALAEWWDNESVSWPLELRATLHRMFSNGSSTVVASSEAFTFSSPSAPNRPKVVHAEAIKTESVIHTMYYHFQSAIRLRDSCMEKHPDTASETATIYDAWDRKHAALREEVKDAVFAFHLARFKGNVPTTLKFIDLLTEQMGQQTQSDALCPHYASVLDKMAESMSQPELLEIIRSQRRVE